MPAGTMAIEWEQLPDKEVSRAPPFTCHSGRLLWVTRLSPCGWCEPGGVASLRHVGDHAAPAIQTQGSALGGVAVGCRAVHTRLILVRLGGYGRLGDLRRTWQARCRHPVRVRVQEGVATASLTTKRLHMPGSLLASTRVKCTQAQSLVPTSRALLLVHTCTCAPLYPVALC